MATQMSKKRKVSNLPIQMPSFPQFGFSPELAILFCIFCLLISSRFSQFVADGVFFAELNEVLTRELAEDGYSGVEVRVTPMRTEIIIRATRTQNVLGDYVFIFSRFLSNYLGLERCCLVSDAFLVGV